MASKATRIRFAGGMRRNPPADYSSACLTTSRPR
jgi:hypothetical protein